MIAKIKATNVYRRNKEAFDCNNYRYIVNQGGTRSSKTFSLCQLFIIKLLAEENKILTIARKTTPSLKSTVMRDFFEILNGLGLYDERLHNKTDKQYKLGNNLVEFISLDQPQKKRGGKRNYLWLNESNEFTYEDFFQLNIRTSELTVLDYNPSDPYHWIHDKIIPKENCKFIQSTYLDNPFLEEAQKKEIEELKDTDPDYWKIYGLGEKGILKDLILTNWELIDEFPQNINQVQYGLDFGYTHPTALLKIGIKENAIYIDELIYETKLTNSTIIERMKTFDIKNSDEIIADSAEPDKIEEISLAGYYISASKKGAGSVGAQIDVLQRKKIYITRNSVNIIKEIKTWKFKKDKEDRVLKDCPIQFNDHAMAALRYGAGEIDATSHFVSVPRIRENNKSQLTSGLKRMNF